jgi:protein involved in polysaccharide export with SLBB domain
MNILASILIRSIKSATKSAHEAVAPVLLCTFMWLQAARAADQAQTNAPGKPEVSTATTEMLLNAIRSVPHSKTNILTQVAITNLSGDSTNLPQAAPTNGALATEREHKLAIGDRLSFRIVEDEDDPKPLFVTDSGDLEVPYIGRVPAENKTCRQLAADIKAALEKDYYYQATVIIAVDVMTKSHGRVYLVGAVRLPGPVELPSDEVLTLSKAILRAGSFTDYADRRHVKVTRKNATEKEDKKSFIVDVGEIFDQGKIETDLVLESGDLIFIPDRLIRF